MKDYIEQIHDLDVDTQRFIWLNIILKILAIIIIYQTFLFSSGAVFEFYGMISSWCGILLSALLLQDPTIELIKLQSKIGLVVIYGCALLSILIGGALIVFSTLPLYLIGLGVAPWVGWGLYYAILFYLDRKKQLI